MRAGAGSRRTGCAAGHSGRRAAGLTLSAPSCHGRAGLDDPAGPRGAGRRRRHGQAGGGRPDPGAVACGPRGDRAVLAGGPTGRAAPGRGPGGDGGSGLAPGPRPAGGCGEPAAVPLLAQSLRGYRAPVSPRPAPQQPVACAACASPLAPRSARSAGVGPDPQPRPDSPAAGTFDPASSWGPGGTKAGLVLRGEGVVVAGRRGQLGPRKSRP